MLCASVNRYSSDGSEEQAASIYAAEAEGGRRSSQNAGSQIIGRNIRSENPQCCNIWVGRVLYLSIQLTTQPSRVEDNELLLPVTYLLQRRADEQKS